MTTSHDHMRPNLDFHDPYLHHRAIAAWNEGDMLGFLGYSKGIICGCTCS